MDRTLQKILRKVESVQLGLLRCSEDDQNVSLQARAGMDETSLNCIVNKESCDISLISKNVRLIQMHKDDYLYISCRVTDEVVRETATIVSMEVLKACWFTRKSKGSVSWLTEKYIYHAIGEEIDLAS